MSIPRCLLALMGLAGNVVGADAGVLSITMVESAQGGSAEIPFQHALDVGESASSLQFDPSFGPSILSFAGNGSARLTVSASVVVGEFRRHELGRIRVVDRSATHAALHLSSGLTLSLSGTVSNTASASSATGFTDGLRARQSLAALLAQTPEEYRVDDVI